MNYDNFFNNNLFFNFLFFCIRLDCNDRKRIFNQKKMKQLSKTESIKRWLQSGKPIRQHQAKTSKINSERLAPVVLRLKQRSMWIINIGKPGKHANYLAFEKGPIKNLEINGYTFEITGAEYFDGYKDMYISIESKKNSVCTSFVVTSEAFRKKSVMKEAWFASLPF